MDWMEKLFGLSPDGGDGSFELAVAIALTMAAVVIAVVLFRRSKGSGKRDFDRPAN